MFRGIQIRAFSMASTPHIFIAGLGNAPYPSTRHSVGQHIVSSLSAQLNIPLSSSRTGYQGSQTAYLPSGPVQITLFKSKYLMNISGPSVASSFRSTQLPPENLVLVYDSLTHAPCKLSTRFGGSAQGHNGVKSVMSSLGSSATHKQFWQFRVGVGRGNSTAQDASSDVGSSKNSKRVIDKSVDAADWVLGPLSVEEKKHWGVGGKGLESVIKEIDRIAGELNKDPSG